MSEERFFLFGPGSLESIQLRMSEHPAGTVRGEARGLYWISCGSGNQHLVQIDEGFSLLPESPSDEFQEHLARAWRGGDADAAAAASHQLVEWALEDWTDPCLEHEEEI